MDESRCDSEILEQAQNDLRIVGNISQRHIGQKIILMYGAIRVFTIVSLVLFILAGVFKWGSAELIGCILMVSLIFSVIVGRSIGFYYRKTNWLEFFTEMAFVLGIVFLLLSFILDLSKFIALLVLFGIFTFMLSPVLGIIRRIVLIVHKETKSVKSTIAEMVILSVPVIIVTWLLLRFGLFDS